MKYKSDPIACSHSAFVYFRNVNMDISNLFHELMFVHERELLLSLASGRRDRKFESKK